MPNAPIPANAQAMPLNTLLIDVEDELGKARSLIDLISFALDGMGSNPEINALHFGVEQARNQVNRALEMLKSAHGQPA